MNYAGSVLAPRTPEELAEAMGSAGTAQQSVALGGAFSKRLMAGPCAPAEVTISTASLNRVLQYDPRDLTISVEAGLTWCELARVLEEHRQMVPLDPPFSGTATIGGIVAANTCGPRRRLYGTARDLIIGMQFATLAGRLVQSGGMVVKNVAGLDMAKLMVGSFGTLAAIAVVNFKVQPRPPRERSFVLEYASFPEAVAARDALLRGVLQPAAVDLLAANGGYTLAVQAGGNAAVIERYQRELGALGPLRALEGPEEEALWNEIRELTPRWLAENPEGVVARVSCTLKEIAAVMETLPGPAVARAASGVVYGYWPRSEAAAEWMEGAVRRGWKAVIEFAPDDRKGELDLWPAPGSDLEVMRAVKRMFDPHGLLNRGRMYRHF